MMPNNSNWEEIYLEYAKSVSSPEYDARLWAWLKNNYQPPQKTKNGSKTNAENGCMEYPEISANAI